MRSMSKRPAVALSLAACVALTAAALRQTRPDGARAMTGPAPAHPAAAHPSAPAARPAGASFDTESRAAMATMMAAMDVEPSGDADADFAARMIAHHRGAIEMARAELRHGRSEQLRRMAQEIIVTQLQEIAAMSSAARRTQPAARGR